VISYGVTLRFLPEQLEQGARVDVQQRHLSSDRCDLSRDTC
jgi:hypothetical protein